MKRRVILENEAARIGMGSLCALGNNIIIIYHRI